MLCVLSPCYHLLLPDLLLVCTLPAGLRPLLQLPLQMLATAADASPLTSLQQAH
jgi:hypothetical protein